MASQRTSRSSGKSSTDRSPGYTPREFASRDGEATASVVSAASSPRLSTARSGRSKSPSQASVASFSPSSTGRGGKSHFVNAGDAGRGTTGWREHKKQSVVDGLMDRSGHFNLSALAHSGTSRVHEQFNARYNEEVAKNSGIKSVATKGSGKRMGPGVYEDCYGAKAIETCAKDETNMFSHYNDAIAQLLYEEDMPIVMTETLAPPLDLGPDYEERLQQEIEIADKGRTQVLEARWKNEKMLFKDLRKDYLRRMQAEQARWLEAQDKISEVSLTQERLLQEAVMTEFDRNGHSLKEVLDERMATYAAACSRGLHFDKKTLEDAAQEAEKERQRWSEEVCDSQMRGIRMDWRASQKEILSVAMRELKRERKEQMNAMTSFADSYEHLHEDSRNTWKKLLQNAQQELEQIMSNYQRALLNMFELKIREISRHRSEQDDLFQAELRDATEAMKAEDREHHKKLRRMHLAALKFRNDYIRDARYKAKQAFDRRRAARTQLVKEDGEAAEEGEDVEDEAGSPLNTVAAKTWEKWTEETDDGSILSKLHKRQGILEEIWERIPGEDDRAIEFLKRVESAVPSTDRVVMLYWDYLQEHGEVAALRLAEDFGSPSPLGEAVPDGAILSQPGSAAAQHRGASSPPGAGRNATAAVAARSPGTSPVREGGVAHPSLSPPPSRRGLVKNPNAGPLSKTPKVWTPRSSIQKRPGGATPPIRVFKQ